VRDAIRNPWYAAVAVVHAARRSALETLDDAQHRLHLSSCPTGHMHDLYRSLSLQFGIRAMKRNLNTNDKRVIL